MTGEAAVGGVPGPGTGACGEGCVPRTFKLGAAPSTRAAASALQPFSPMVLPSR